MSKWRNKSPISQRSSKFKKTLTLGTQGIGKTWTRIQDYIKKHKK